MKKLYQILVFLVIPVVLSGCHKKSDEPPATAYTIDVILNNTPFNTNEFLRIPYTLKTWEWKKSGMKLKQIKILDDVKKTIVQTLDSADIPKVWMDPLPPNPVAPWDKISSYYISIQLPIPLNQQPPVRISHQLVLRDTVHNTDLTVDGGVYTPDYSQMPVSISSPIKGTDWLVFNQSTNEYHFFVLLFYNGKIGNGERFAFDASQMDPTFNAFYSGNPALNSAYFCYGDTLYAVADGIVTSCLDTITESDGNLRNHVNIKNPIDNAGNYVIINIGNGKFAMYAHCVINSLMVSAGDTVKEGQPVALLGNSGNSDAPHLHFQLGDSEDFFMCNGVPFVLKKFTKIGSYHDPTPITPVEYYNTMNEQRLVILL